MLLVKEKDGSKRLCVDYRPLNKVVTEDKYSLAEAQQKRGGIAVDPSRESAVLHFTPDAVYPDMTSLHSLQDVVLRCIKDDLRRSSDAEGLSSCACSRKLKINKRNYPTDELELAAAAVVLKVRRRYLYGSSL
ncbi:hypothetical protein L195_g054179, partial [Trifolium pratense]